MQPLRPPAVVGEGFGLIVPTPGRDDEARQKLQAVN